MHKDFGYYFRPSVHNSSTYTDENSMIKVPERMNHSMQILHEKKDYDNVNQSTFIKRPDMLIRADLSKRNLKEIPDLFLRKEIQAQMQQSGSRRNSFTKEDSPYALLEIDLSENKLTTMSLSPLIGKSLLTLNLSRNRLIDLSVLQYLTKLRELHLAYNYIESSQFDYLNYLKSLEIIDISHNHLKEQRIIDIIENMSKLRIFINNMNDYSRIVFTKNSPNLQQIYLEGNSLSTLEFHRPKPALGILSIKGNHLVEITGLKNLENLEHINCNHNSLVNLAWLRNSSNIKIINAESNELHSFTPNQLPYIEILNLSNNKLQTMDFMAYCPHLKSLIFSGNKLECLPRFNNIFPSLIFLDLSKNSIREIFGLERFPNLLELNLSHNKISNLDQLLPELVKLKSLRSLDLRMNKFNANLNFNELLPNASSLKSLELIEQMITPVQEDVFLQFVAYRTIIISSLNRSLTTLDHVEITKYEISMIQEMANKEEEAPNGGQLLTFHEQPSFTHNNPQNQSQYEDFKMPHNFFRANAHCPSPIKKVADEDYFSVPANSQSFILKKSNNSPFIRIKNNSFVEQDSFVYQKNQPMFQNVEIHRPPAPTKSYPCIDQNSSAVFADQHNKASRSFKSVGTPSTISKAPIEPESMYKRSFPTNDSTAAHIKHSYYTPERTNLNNFLSQDSRAKFTGLGISGLKTFDSVVVLENTDEEESQQQQVVDQKDWKKVIDDIAVSQKMVQNLVQSSCKMGLSIEEPIVTEKYPEIKKTKEYQSIPVPPLKKKIDQNDSLAIVDMLAEEMTKEYQENFEKIKNKFKNTLKQQLGVKEEQNVEPPKITSKETKRADKITKDKIPPFKSPGSGSIKRDRHQSVESSNRKSQKLKPMESVTRRLDSLESTNRNRARLQPLESTDRSRRNKTADKETPYEIEQTPGVDTNKQLIEKEAMKLFEAFKSLLEEKLHQQTSQPIVENPVPKNPVHRNSIPSDHIVITDQSYEAQSQKNKNPKISPFVSQGQMENDHQDTNDITSAESTNRRKKQPQSQSSHQENKKKISQPSETDSKEERKRNRSSQDQQEHSLPENLITKSSKSNTREIHPHNTRENSDQLDSLNNRDKFMSRAIIDYQNIQQQQEEEEDEGVPVDLQQEEEDPSETILALALSLYKNRLPSNSIFIDSAHLKNIFSELLQTLRIEYNPDDVQELIATISDFIPKKLTEQGFIDLFSLTEVSDFLIRNNIFEHSQTARFTESFLNNNHPPPTEDQGYEIQDEQPSITLETLSLIQSQNRTQQTKAGITENERSASDFYYNSGPSPSPHKQTSMHKHFQSLSPSETTWQRTVTGQSELIDYKIIKSPDFYGHQMSDFIIQLMPYSKTPPRPVFNKETNQSILKEIQSNSTEYELISAVLSTLGFELSRVVKTYNHKQHKKLEKLLEDNCLLKTLEYQFGNMGSKGRMLRELQKNNSLAVRNDRTIQFYDKVVLFHSAKPKDLSELIEHPNGFKDVYKNKPGHLLFSQKGHICLKQYQSFMKRHYRNELNTEDQNTSLIQGKNEKPKWRVLVSHVFLGSCYVEKEMNFRSFMYEGEEKVVELLREGYSSIYFEKDDAYLVLLSEQCVPIYLCEFSFENMRGTEGNTLFYTTSC